MILFEKGLTVEDDVAALINDPLGLVENPEYIEKEIINYINARAKSGFLKVREDAAKEDVKDVVKDDGVIKAEAEIKP